MADFFRTLNGNFLNLDHVIITYRITRDESDGYPTAGMGFFVLDTELPGSKGVGAGYVCESRVWDAVEKLLTKRSFAGVDCKGLALADFLRLPSGAFINLDQICSVTAEGGNLRLDFRPALSKILMEEDASAFLKHLTPRVSHIPRAPTAEARE